MARVPSSRIPGPLRANGLYLVIIVIVFAMAVFLLFRGQASVPQQAAAGRAADEASSAEDSAEPDASAGAETEALREPPASELPPASAPSQEAGPPPTVPAAPPAGTEPNPQVDDVLSRATTLIQSQPGKVIEVRNTLNDALQMPMAPSQRKAVKEQLAKLADDWLFGPASFAGDTLCGAYTVKSGDLLHVIGNRHKAPYEILMQINHISRPENLRAGRTIKVVNGPFHAKIYRSSFTMDLYLQQMYVCSFTVGLGKPGRETPTGQWRVSQNGKMIKPTWTDPDSGHVYTASDPDYPLGSRWIALDGIGGDARDRTGFAIHGTKDPDQIGTAGSRGCIRMYNGDAILMYKLLFPVYSKIEVLE